MSARGEFPPLGRFVEVGDTRIHYVERGSGPPVVLLHGNPGSLHHFLGVLEALGTTHRAIAFDRPGHGWSDLGRGDAGSPVVQAQLLQAAARRLGAERPVLVAESWSGSLALAWALEFPDDVAAVVGAPGTFYDAPELGSPLYAALLAPIVGPILRRTIVPPIVRALIRRKVAGAYAPCPLPPGAARRAEVLFSRPSELWATARDVVRRAQVVPDLASRYSEIRTPVVLVVGLEDGHVDQQRQAYRLHRELPSSRLVELPGVGHLIAETSPGPVVDAVRSVS